MKCKIMQVSAFPLPRPS